MGRRAVNGRHRMAVDVNWLRLDDGFSDHPKITGLTDTAFRVHVCGLNYCARYLTDGMVPAARVPAWVGGRRRPETVVGELVRAGLWHPVDGADEYAIHDFGDWNPTRDRVERARKVNRHNALKRWENNGQS